MYGKGKSPYNEPDIRDHPYITSEKGQGRWVRKIAIFDDVHYCIYADLVVGSQKVQKYADVIKGWTQRSR